jgi:serine protease inhibitor
VSKLIDRISNVFSQFWSKAAYNALAKPYTKFSLKLLKEIAKQEPDKNIIISPMSVAVALAIVYNGAEGDTKDAMSRVLELDGFDLDTINTANAALLDELDDLDPKIDLTMTNKIEIDDRAAKSIFLQIIREHYKAEVADSGQPDKIKLTNKIKFKGQWTDKFNKRSTRDEPFTLLNGEKKPCLMMSSPRQDWKYYRHEEFRFHMAKMPYGNKKTSMCIFLSSKSITVYDFLEDFTPVNWRKWFGNMSDTDGFITLPRVEIDYAISLERILKTLGMGIAFDQSQADFSAIYSFPAWIGQVNHKAKVEVNEEGTEAVAKTFISLDTAIGPGKGKEKNTFHMVVDRPFIYAIVDNKTEMPLFLGITVDP